MKKDSIDFKGSGLFSKKFNDFINNHGDKEYYPTYKNIDNISSNKSFNKEKRELLHIDFIRQYESIKRSKKVDDNIKSILSENTFTITTGHQLNIFTGPLYVIYKIISCIKLSEDLNKKFPNKNFVPVYWMASEDHDFDEIKSCYSNGKNYEWKIKPSGAVGDIDPKSLKDLINKIPDVQDFFSDAYLTSDSLSLAVRKYMNAIFGDYGLLIFDPSSEVLKDSFNEIIKDDIFNNTMKDIESSYDDRSHVHVREINFFYKGDKFRERIIRRGDEYSINNMDRKFSSSELKSEIENHPDRFSPNVISRCLYQEFILPNVVYVGGPAEVVYWIGFKKFFDHYKIDFPVVSPRDFVLMLSKKSQKIMKNYNIELKDLFLGKNHIEKKAMNVFEDRDKNFSDEISKIKSSLQEIADKYNMVDKTMKPHILASSKRMEKVLLQIEGRFIKSLKGENKKLVLKVGELYDEIFPSGSIQERKENMITFYDQDFIGNLKNSLNPLDLHFKVLEI